MTYARRSNRTLEASDCIGRRPKSSLSAAVIIALYGAPPATFGQQQPEANPSGLQEIIVTATRRQQTAVEVPYSISVVTPEQLTRANVTDLPSLMMQVPGLSMYNFGARFAAATAPIIRGLNATSEPRGFRTFEQDPVGTYIGNSPVNGGYYQLDDLERVEILRGPQGTLYGAGALGGAIRYIPNDPKLGAFSGELSATGKKTNGSDGTGYVWTALLNLPIGDTFALRLPARYDYEPGYINVYGILAWTGPVTTGPRVLADPADIVNSPSVFSGKNDWNFQKTLTTRPSALWRPTDKFTAEVAYLYANVQGDGSPNANPYYKGGPYAIDPRITFPAGGLSQEFSSGVQPFSRITSLASLDLSYDAGFGTLSSTTSYHRTQGSTIDNDTYTFVSFPFIGYYAGVPTNPRYIDIQEFSDHSHTFTEELRLVSKGGPGSVIDYTIGLFYENQKRHGSWNVTDPGSYERTVAQGCTGYYTQGSVFPDCLVRFGPDGVTSFNQVDDQSFEDKSIFGELAWHFNAHGQITVGGRHFSQSFTDAQSYTDYPFQTFIPAVPHSSSAQKNTWKVNPSYEYATSQFVYAIWSQGFRRGGANSVPLTGFLAESPVLASYAPDSVNNYELGLKGRFANGLTYTVALFYIDWSNPQISESTPAGNLVVVNGNTARSKGVEFESNGPLGIPGFSYNVGFAYAAAELTSDFSLPANDGSGQVLPGQITGTAGQQLPGSPKVSAAATILYEQLVAPGYDMSLQLNGTYRSHAPLGTSGIPATQNSDSFGLINFSGGLTHRPWRGLLYVTNIANKRAVLSPPTMPNLTGGLTNSYLLTKPREVGLRAFYEF
jgi:outer membrane receptor protein involved in Fe transport